MAKKTQKKEAEENEAEEKKPKPKEAKESKKLLAQAEADEYLEKGFLLARAIIELVGGPKEHILSTLKSYVAKINNEKEYFLVKADFSEPEEKDGLFMVFAEVEFLAKDASALAFFCFDYMPASIEIIQPEILHYRAVDFAGFFNDLQHRLHTIDFALKEITAKNKNLLRNSNRLLRNMAILVIDNKGPQGMEELGAKIGIKPEHLKSFVSQMSADGWLREEKGKFYLGERKEE